MFRPKVSEIEPDDKSNKKWEDQANGPTTPLLHT